MFRNPEQSVVSFERATQDRSAVLSRLRPLDFRDLIPFDGAADLAGGSVRRLLNVAVAATGLVLGAPLMLLIAVLIKLLDGGPVIYRQTRVGVDRRRPGSGGNHRRSVDLGGRPFTMYKFRTMRVAQDERAQVWASPDDPRVTRLGRLLRRSRLDELPQLWNVLRGDMNIVGPRPEQPEIFMDLRTQIRRYSQRQRVLPGITGWAQVNLTYDRDVADVRRKLEYDLRYISRQSALEDMRIMARTIPIVLLRRGAW